MNPSATRFRGWRVNPPAWFVLTAICVCQGLYAGVPAATPIWIETLVERNLLTAVQTGWLTSAELLCAAFAGFVLSALGPPKKLGGIAVGAAVCVVLANLFATLPGGLYFLMVGRVLSGLAIGVLGACAMILASRCPDPTRAFACTILASVLVGAAINFALPLLRHSITAPTLVIAGLGVIAAVVSLVGLPRISEGTSDRHTSKGAVTLPSLLLGAAFFCTSVGCSVVWPFLLIVGARLGFSSESLGPAIGVAYLTNLVGPYVTHLLGERAGLMIPIAVGLLILAVSWAVLVVSPNISIMIACMSFVGIGYTFFFSYAMTVSGIIDRSGRLVGLAPTILSLGTAAAAPIGGVIVDQLGVAFLGIVASILILISIGLVFLTSSVAGISWRPTAHHSVSDPYEFRGTRETLES